MYLDIEERSGSKYYSYRGSFREKGKVKTKKVYLGKENKAIQLLADFNSKKPDIEKVYSYTGEIVLEEIAKRLKFSTIMSKHVQIRTEWDIGEFLKILVIERCLFPVSKWALAEIYYNKSILALRGKIPSKAFSDSNIYNYMEYFESKIHQIHSDLVLEAFKIFPPKNDVLLLDGTSLPCHGRDVYPDLDELDDINDSEGVEDIEFSDEEILSNKDILRLNGYSRSKRPDLAQVNVMLGVNQRHIPLYFDVFSGNTNDLEMFKHSLTQLKTSYKGLLEKMRERYIIFDRGNLSDKNSKRLDSFCKEWKLFFIGGVKSVDFKKELQNLDETNVPIIFQAGDTLLHGKNIKKKVFGNIRNVVLYTSKTVRKHKLLEFQKKLDKVLVLLNSINNDNKLSTQEKAISMKSVLRKNQIVQLFWIRKFDKKGNPILTAETIPGLYQIRSEKIAEKMTSLKEKSDEFKQKLDYVQAKLAEIDANESFQKIQKIQKIRRILRKHSMVRLFWIKNLENTNNNNISLSDVSDSTIYQILPQRVDLKKSLYGKFVVISNNLNLSSSEIIHYYKAKEVVEHEFHILKSLLKIHPQYHFTKVKINAHNAIIHWGMLLLSVLRCLLEDNDLNYSFEELLRIIKQGALQKAIYIYPDLKNFELTRLIDIEAEQEKIFKILKIKIQFFDIDNMVLQK